MNKTKQKEFENYIIERIMELRNQKKSLIKDRYSIPNHISDIAFLEVNSSLKEVEKIAKDFGVKIKMKKIRVQLPERWNDDLYLISDKEILEFFKKIKDKNTTIILPKWFIVSLAYRISVMYNGSLLDEVKKMFLEVKGE